LGIRRFFVSPQESGELCLMASIMGDSGNVTKAAIVGILKVYLPNFEHIETGKGLD
jgi:hypothetical protein